MGRPDQLSGSTKASGDTTFQAKQKRKEPEPTPQVETPKKNLLQQKRDAEAPDAKKKKPSQTKAHGEADVYDSPEKDFPLSNQKRSECEFCGRARCSRQVGAACPFCKLALRHEQGHQRLDVLRDDPALADKVRRASLELQKADEKPKPSDSVDTRLTRMESMMEKLMEHFGLS